MATQQQRTQQQERPQPGPTEVWAVCEFDNGYEDGQPLFGTSVIALYAKEQTAEQHLSRDRLRGVGVGFVQRMTVHSALLPTRW